jgi:hypothetical protein
VAVSGKRQFWTGRHLSVLVAQPADGILNFSRAELTTVSNVAARLPGLGMPAAFIETAWRRYTKHSRNKAQEIQGAIMPLVETYMKAGPFIGAVLAGVFTKGALMALNSHRDLGLLCVHYHAHDNHQNSN